MKRILCIIAAAALLASCAAEQPQTSVAEERREPGVSFFTEPAETAAEETVDPFATAAEQTTAGQTEVEPPEFIPPTTPEEPIEWSYEEFSRLYECEEGEISGEGSAGSEREDYSGSGAVRLEGGVLSLELELPASQHYNVSLRFASDAPTEGKMSCDDPSFERKIVSDGSGEYQTLMFANIYLKKGSATLIFGDFSAPCDLDCALIESSDDIKDLDYALDTDEPVCKNATDETKELYAYLCSLYGSATLSAQQCSPGCTAETDAIYRALGRYPAIRFGELRGEDIDLAIDWAKSGGIVGYSWYWEMNDSLYPDGFDLSKAVTDLDIASMGSEALGERYASGDVTAETLMIVDGIDMAAIQLKRLADEGIPVLLRPLPEAGNGVFWWGCDSESYLWLYKLIFERFDFYHGLGNIIWVWNGQSADFYPGDGMTDIISLDLYYPDGEKPDGSGINFLLAAKKFGNKPVALSECGVLPSPDGMNRDGCRWLFASVFSGEYALTGGELPGKNMTVGEWNAFYSAEKVVTKDEIEYNQ